MHDLGHEKGRKATAYGVCFKVIVLLACLIRLSSPQEAFFWSSAQNCWNPLPSPVATIRESECNAIARLWGAVRQRPARLVDSTRASGIF